MENKRNEKMSEKFGDLDTKGTKSIPRANKRITDDEVEQILKSAKEKLSDKKDETKSVETTEKKEEKNIAEKAEKTEEKKSAEKTEKKEEKNTAEKTEKKEEKNTAEKVEKKEEKKSAEKIEKKEDLQVEPSENKRIELPKDIVVEEPVVIDNHTGNTEKINTRRAISNILEGIWIGVKIVVLLLIITAVSGVILSKNMMIRGENGSRQSLNGMQVSGSVAVNKSNEQEKVDDWLKKVEREKLTLEADDKSILVARQIITNSKSDKWVVILHGYNGSMEDVYDIAMHYAEEGYNILTPDLRGNGESEGSFLGMGWTDRLDIINWIDVILKKNPSAQVVIHGIDTGADAALMLSGEPLKSSIKAIVAEGAYPNAWDIVKKEYKARYEKWPVFPFLNMLNPVMKVWAGYSLKDANALKQVKNTSVPILLINGGKDTYVTEDMTKEIDKAIASAHERLIIPTGTHEDCRYAEPDNYYDKTFDFTDKYVK